MSISCFKLRVDVLLLILRIFEVLDSLAVLDIAALKVYDSFVSSLLKDVHIKVDPFVFEIDLIGWDLCAVHYKFVDSMTLII